MLTQKLNTAQMAEIEDELKKGLVVREHGTQWQLMSSVFIGPVTVAHFDDELSAWIAKDDVVKAVMQVLRRANKDPYIWEATQHDAQRDRRSLRDGEAAASRWARLPLRALRRRAAGLVAEEALQRVRRRDRRNEFTNH
jgi:hypothetical protein